MNPPNPEIMMTILRTMHFSYCVGGVTMPIYRGDGDVAMNTNSDASIEDDQDELMRRARLKVASEGCFEPSMVKITDSTMFDRT